MINKKLAVLFSGTGSNFAYILKHLHTQGFEVVVAITNKPQTTSQRDRDSKNS